MLSGSRLVSAVYCVLCAVCCVLCAVCCVLCAMYTHLVQVLCGRCTGLAHGAMIPAVKDFTQKAWLEQQRQLLTNTQQTQQSTQQQQQQQQLPQGQADLPPAAAGVEPAASASQAVVEFSSSSSSSSGVGEPLELLGKVLVTAEELRDKIAVSGMPGSGVVGCLHR